MSTRLLIVVGAALALIFVPAALAVAEEVIVYFKSSAVELPEPGAIVTPEALASCDPGIHSILTGNNVELIFCVVPSFSPADTLFLTPDGLNVAMPDLSRLFVLSVPENHTDNLINELAASPEVVFAERNGAGIERSAPPDDPRFDLQWALNPGSVASVSPHADVNVMAAWDITQGSPSVSIGILDPGGTVWEDHPDVLGRVSGGILGNVSDHAMHVAGIAAATGNNAEGIAGVDWNCGIVTHEFTSYSNLVDDMYAFRNAGVFAINHSWGQEDDTFLISVGWMFAVAYKANILNVVSMPADYSPSIFPNSYNEFGLSVAATTNDTEKADYSVAHPFVDLAAPGGDFGLGLTSVYSTVTQPAGDPYGYRAGTSMAAPHVTGAAALLKSYDPSLYNDDVAGLLRYSAFDANGGTKPGFDSDLGWGRLDVAKAMSLLQPPFSLVRPVANGGSTYYTFPSTYMRFVGFGGSPVDGYYAATPVEVRRSVTFPSLYAIPPKVWGRGVETIGYANTNPNYTVGWCEPVPGTVTKTGCVLRTFVFDLYTIDPTPVHVGFVPVAASNVRLAYSINGIRDTSPPISTLSNPNGGETLQAGQSATIQWQVADEYLAGVTCRILLDLDTGAGTSVWMIAESQTVDSEGNGSFYWSIPGGQPGGTTYKIRVIANDTNNHEGVDVSDQYFTINPWSGKGGPPPPPDPCEAPCAPIRWMPDYVTDLLPASPNPFNPETRLRYTLAGPDEITLRVFDVRGRQVATVVAGIQQKGLHEVPWNGTDDSGRELPSGVYFIALNADRRVFTQKLVILK